MISIAGEAGTATGEVDDAVEAMVEDEEVCVNTGIETMLFVANGSWSPTTGRRLASDTTTFAVDGARS